MLEEAALKKDLLTPKSHKTTKLNLKYNLLKRIPTKSRTESSHISRITNRKRNLPKLLKSQGGEGKINPKILMNIQLLKMEELITMRKEGKIEKNLHLSKKKIFTELQKNSSMKIQVNLDLSRYCRG